MTALWMLYSIAVALLLGLAALAAERVRLVAGRSTRWVWLAAFAGSLILPAVLPRTPYPSDDAGAPAAATAGAPLPGDAPDGSVSVEATSGRDFSAWERALRIGWLAGSALFAAALVLSAIRLERERRGWRLCRIAGTRVRVSERTGPAVAGFLWPEVVVPEWVRGWDPEAQRLLLEHETEHERAGDTHLLLASLVGLLLMPWNPALWWHARRLRFAIEVDCDARVLRTRPDVGRYGRLLIEVARAASPRLVPVAAFSTSRSFLERRIRILVAPPQRPRSGLHPALWALIILPPLTVGALPPPEKPDFGRLTAGDRQPPTRPTAERDDAPPAAGDVPGDLSSAPTFTAFTVSPELRNAAEVGRAVAARLSAPTRRAVSGDTVVLWAFVDVDGVVRNTRLVRSSGDLALDGAARETLLEIARFAAARDGEDKVPAWIRLPLTVGAPNQAEPLRIPISTTPQPDLPVTTRDRAAGDPGASLARPELADRQTFLRQVARSYPSELRNAGVGGTTILWALVDATGSVRSTRLARSSGDEQLDLVAREVLRTTRFAPGRGSRGAMEAWVQVPIEFIPR